MREVYGIAGTIDVDAMLRNFTMATAEARLHLPGHEARFIQVAGEWLEPNKICGSLDDFVKSMLVWS